MRPQLVTMCPCVTRSGANDVPSAGHCVFVCVKKWETMMLPQLVTMCLCVTMLPVSPSNWTGQYTFCLTQFVGLA